MSIIKVIIVINYEIYSYEICLLALVDKTVD